MVSRDYFIKQAAALLRLAKAVKEPALSAKLVSRAADLEEKAKTRPAKVGAKVDGALMRWSPAFVVA